MDDALKTRVLFI